MSTIENHNLIKHCGTLRPEFAFNFAKNLAMINSRNNEINEIRLRSTSIESNNYQLHYYLHIWFNALSMILAIGFHLY